jgi:hypothetical protein
MSWQGAMVAGRTIVPARADSRDRRSNIGILPRLVLARDLLLILEFELQLVRAKLLRTPAKLMTRQALDQQAQLIILGM